MIATAPRYELAEPVTPPPRQVQRCSRCKSEGHNARRCPERDATWLPGPGVLAQCAKTQKTKTPDRAHLLALALELRREVEAWVAAAPTTEAARERDRARLSMEYVVKKVKEAR